VGIESEMRVLLAHALTPKRRRIARVLTAAGHEVAEVAAQAVQLPDAQGVARAQGLEAGVEARPPVVAAAHPVLVDALAVDARLP